MMGMIWRALKPLVEWWQRRCEHDPRSVSADIHEGAHEGENLQWCRVCGAARIVIERAETRDSPAGLDFCEWRVPAAASWQFSRSRRRPR